MSDRYKVIIDEFSSFNWAALVIDTETNKILEVFSHGSVKRRVRGANRLAQKLNKAKLVGPDIT